MLELIKCLILLLIFHLCFLKLFPAPICRDLAVILLGLSKEFNIDRFLHMLLEALVDCRWEINSFFPIVFIFVTFFTQYLKMMIICLQFF